MKVIRLRIQDFFEGFFNIAMYGILHNLVYVAGKLIGSVWNFFVDVSSDWEVHVEFWKFIRILSSDGDFWSVPDSP